MVDTMISAHNLHKSYWVEGKHIHVLQGLDIEISQGEMVSIIGKSGSGKSTFLHVAGTLDMPDEGQLFIEGNAIHELSAMEIATLRNHKIGFVFQFHHLMPEFSAVENVMLPALIARWPKAKAKEHAEKILTEVGMEHRLQHRPSELSGGEQQRVALARALVMEPPILFADEVTGNLDEKTAEGIHSLLFDLNRRLGITLILVTHNRSLAMSMSRQLLLEEGKFVELT